MDHVAIMRKSWGLMPKILSGKKKIESRWYSVKYRPWNRIGEGDTVYFKNTGEPVTVKATVERVMQFSNLTVKTVFNLLNEYGEDDGIDKKNRQEFFNRFKDKKYCILIFLKDPMKIVPFQIDKNGFGAMSAWIAVSDISLVVKQ